MQSSTSLLANSRNVHGASGLTNAPTPPLPKPSLLQHVKTPCPTGNGPKEGVPRSLANWWSTGAALRVLQRKRYEKPTQLRIYEVRGKLEEQIYLL